MKKKKKFFSAIDQSTLTGVWHLPLLSLDSNDFRQLGPIAWRCGWNVFHQRGRTDGRYTAYMSNSRHWAFPCVLRTDRDCWRSNCQLWCLRKCAVGTRLGWRLPLTSDNWLKKGSFWERFSIVFRSLPKSPTSRVCRQCGQLRRSLSQREMHTKQQSLL